MTKQITKSLAYWVNSAQWFFRYVRTIVCGTICSVKAIYIALMLGSMGGSIALLVQGFDRYRSRLFEGILFWVLSVAVVGLGVYSFKQAAKRGRIDDMP